MNRICLQSRNVEKGYMKIIGEIQPFKLVKISKKTNSKLEQSCPVIEEKQGAISLLDNQIIKQSFII